MNNRDYTEHDPLEWVDSTPMIAVALLLLFHGAFWVGVGVMAGWVLWG